MKFSGNYSLRKQVRVLQWLTILLSILCTGMICLFLNQKTKEILTVKGLIIVDEKGNPSIMLGNPVPAHEGRIRKDSLNGIVWLDQKGTDRLYMGRDSKLQMGGELVERGSTGWSLLINDTLGDERGGFGLWR